MRSQLLRSQLLRSQLGDVRFSLLAQMFLDLHLTLHRSPHISHHTSRFPLPRPHPSPHFILHASQFARRHGPAASGGAHGFERTQFLRRGRQPKDLSTYLSGVSAGYASGGHGGGGGSSLGGGGIGADDDAFVSLADLSIGNVVHVAGTPMRILGCEPSSRALLVVKGMARELGMRDKGWPGEDLEPWEDMSVTL